MSGPLDHKARIVAELQERLGEATTDDDQDFLASQLSEAGNDLEGACLIALRNARLAEAMAEGVKQIEADNKARRQRLETKSKKIRAAVAQAMAEAGLPAINSADLTVSFRMGRPGISYYSGCNESLAKTYPDLVKVKQTFAWNDDAVRALLETGKVWGHGCLTNPKPSLTVRGK